GDLRSPPRPAGRLVNGNKSQNSAWQAGQSLMDKAFMESKANPWYSLEGKTVWVIGAAGYLGSPITEALDGLCRKVICSELEGRAAALVAEKKLQRTVAHNLNATDLGPLGAEV